MHPPPGPGRKSNRVELVAKSAAGTEAAAAAEAASAPGAVSALEERMIVELCLAGQTDHFRRLVERHQRGIVNLTYRMLGNRAEAEDMAQQSFIDAFTALRDFNPSYRFSSWLYRIAINNCKDYLKSRKRTEQRLDEDVSGSEAVFAGRLPDPERALVARQAEAELQAALDRVPVKYRTVLVLKDIEELSYEEIRTILRLPVTTLKIRVVRARKMLKDILERQP